MKAETQGLRSVPPALHLSSTFFQYFARHQRVNHVWSYDFVSAMTHDGRTLRMLTLIDEYTRECLAIRCLSRDTSSADRSVK
jgi:hypothetical protein